MAITPGKIEVVQPKMYVVSRLYQVISKKIASKSDTRSAKGNWVQIRYTECIYSTVYLDRVAWASFFSLSLSLRSRMSSSGSFLKFLMNSWLVASDSSPFVNSSDSFRVVRHAFFGPLLGPSILSFQRYKLIETSQKKIASALSLSLSRKTGSCHAYKFGRTLFSQSQDDVISKFSFKFALQKSRVPWVWKWNL